MNPVRIFFLALLIFNLTCHLAHAQKLEKYYTQRVQEGGDIYFIQPNEDFQNTDDRSGFVFDITYREGTENATLNFTFYTDDPVKAKFVELTSGQKTVKAEAEKLYVDFVKKKWENRYTVQVPFTSLHAIFGQPGTPVFTVKTETGSLVFSVKKRKWEKYSEAINKILYIISQNQ